MKRKNEVLKERVEVQLGQERASRQEKKCWSCASYILKKYWYFQDRPANITPYT